MAEPPLLFYDGGARTAIPFLVTPAIAKQKKEEGEDTIRPVLIVRYVTMAGEEGLWALKLDPPDGKSNPGIGRP